MDRQRSNQRSKQQIKSPHLLSTLTEVPRTLLEIGSLALSMPALATLPRGDGHPVLVLPGFMASDESTYILRRYLSSMGYKALPWKLGRNTGKPELLERKVGERLLEIHDRYGEKVSLIGQSLGGVYARELGRNFSDLTRQVITLGSPFSAGESKEVTAFVSRLFKKQSGLSVHDMRERVGVSEQEYAPPVPMTAIYSKGDGIVNWRVCRESKEDHETQNIQVAGSHCGMGFNPMIYYIIKNRLCQKADAWKRYESPSARLLNNSLLPVSM